MSNQKTNQKVLGIDLGTTNSAAAIYEGGHATVIPSAEASNSFEGCFSHPSGV